jgi:hypothetical protein
MMLHKLIVQFGLALWLLFWGSDATAGFVVGDLYASARLGSISIGQVALTALLPLS